MTNKQREEQALNAYNKAVREAQEKERTRIDRRNQYLLSNIPGLELTEDKDTFAYFVSDGKYYFSIYFPYDGYGVSPTRDGNEFERYAIVPKLKAYVKSVYNGNVSYYDAGGVINNLVDMGRYITNMRNYEANKAEVDAWLKKRDEHNQKCKTEAYSPNKRYKYRGPLAGFFNWLMKPIK